MANNGVKRYTLRRDRPMRGLTDGFSLDANDVLRSTTDEQFRRHFLLPALDSATPDCPWGRFVFDARFVGEVLLTVRVFASNDRVFISRDEITDIDDFLLDPTIPAQRKEQLFGLANGISQSSNHDMLLYGQNGRYLWIWLELSGSGSVEFEHFRVYVPGDNFYQTFPEVYHADGEFFHRYLSVFSSLYNDFQEQIDSLAQYLDADTAPPAALPVLASWLGLEVDDGLLDEGDLRKLLKAAFPLISAKGTLQAVEGVIKLFVEQPTYIVERNLLDKNQMGADAHLYGDSPFDFTVLINCKADEKLRARLRFLIDQFKPVRSRARIVFLQDCAGLDAFTYLDMNSAISQSANGRLDDGIALTGMTHL